ncbi:Ig-like domain-containing protein [Listeria grandensis]|uniref:Ig-like domain-containing protein n=1 Tax=Listeria grandensis TaxID=1494963 RepID=UPI00164D538B|nr:Ig-like domain-containing protein [Listeria grandensis]MBC6314198.1 hypothetical protein [Listeria grandensis]
MSKQTKMLAVLGVMLLILIGISFNTSHIVEADSDGKMPQITGFAVDPINNESTTITGSGIPGTAITYYFESADPNSISKYFYVPSGGKFKITLPKTLDEGDWVHFWSGYTSNTNVMVGHAHTTTPIVIKTPYITNLTGKIYGTGAPGGTISVYHTGTLLGSSTADNKGNFVVQIPTPTPTENPPGDYTLSFIQRENGKITAAEPRIKDNFLPLTLSFSSQTPPNTINGKSLPNHTIQLFVNGNFHTFTTNSDGTFTYKSPDIIETGSTSIALFLLDEFGQPISVYTTFI